MLALRIIKLSFRAVLRDKRRSIIIFLVAFASYIALIFYMGYAAMLRELFTKGSIYGDYGHIEIFKSDTPKEIIETGTGSYDYMISEEDFLKAKKICLGFKDVMYVTPRINIAGIISSSVNSRQFNADAIIPMDLISLYAYFPVNGEIITDDYPEDIVIGELLADELGIKAGDAALVSASGISGTIEAMNARVAGLFSMGNEYYDRSKVYMNIKAAKKLMLTDSYSKIIVLLESENEMYNIQDKLNGRFKERGLDLKAFNFYQVAVNVVQLVEYYENKARISIILLAIVIFFCLIVSLYIAVTGKAREFSTMRTLGISRSVLFFIIIAEGVMLIFISLLLGNMLLKPVMAFVNSLNLQATATGGTRPYPFSVSFEFTSVLKLCLIYISAGILGSAIPAAGVLRLDIVKGLKNN